MATLLEPPAAPHGRPALQPGGRPVPQPGAMWHAGSRTPPLVLVAHRGPLRSGGGLVTALRDLVRHAPEACWICAATDDAEGPAVMTRSGVPVTIAPGVRCDVHAVAIDPAVHHDFYAVIANPLLWFVQHALWDLGATPNITARELAAWHHGYVRVNEMFAARLNHVARASSPDAVVMMHDYHFYLVPAMARAAGVEHFLHFFVHIPWPHPDAWRVLPGEVREAILRGLLGSDVVAFHTGRYARNFLLSCHDLLGLDIDERRGTVRYDGRDVAVRFYPISVDAASLRALAATPETEQHERELAALRRERLVVRVDRIDPAKNILRGFLAYDSLLERHPELNGCVTFLALLQPSREDVPQYVDYRRRVEALVHSVNERRGTPEWQPIELRIGENLPRAVAAYRDFDVLMVNAVADGMNLVAKEALVVNRRDGVLALSENTGAHEELGAVALTLAPFDIDQQADALWEALTMPAEERAMRHAAALDIVCTNNVDKWLTRQLADIHELTAAR